MTLAPRAVVVRRRTELEELLDRHGTRGQAEFFLRSRGRDLSEVQDHHDSVEESLHAVSAAIPRDWRRGGVERADLDRFLFEPEDVVVVVGQDGLVANTAKYLDGQPLIGVNPEPGWNPGVLVPHTSGDVVRLLGEVLDGSASWLNRAMVGVQSDDGQKLFALNEVYIGHRSHQSARYRLELPDGRSERQSSSGLLIGTGTGSTGWCLSTWRERHSDLPLPLPFERRLAWFAREAWPSPFTGADLTEGLLDEDAALNLVVESDSLVVFGDGLEVDHLTPTWGQGLAVRVAARTLRCVA